MDDCANPLFLRWVKEWWDQAKERNTKGVLAYRNAYESLRACPVRFEHPDQLLALKGFGPKTCSRLMDRLIQHCVAHDLPIPTKRRLPAAAARRLKDAMAGDAAGSEDLDNEPADGPSASRRPGSTTTRKRKAYVPMLRQGGYGILMALSSPDAEGREWLSKEEIMELAQPHCDTSYTVRPPGKYYTAWDSIKTLLNNDLVAERRRPAKRYALTDDGWEMANKLWQVVGEASGSGGGSASAGSSSGTGGSRNGRPTTAVSSAQSALREKYAQSSQPSLRVENQQQPTQIEERRPPSVEDLIPDGHAITTDDDLPDVAPLVLPAGSYSVQLVLDVRERVTGQRSYMEGELTKKHGVQPLVRALSVGDALWVAKFQDPGLLRRLRGVQGDDSSSSNSSSNNDDDDYSEIVLDWVVERKRQDDLVYSIRDGRFREQKFRLRRSGLRHVVYVVEESGMDVDMMHRYEEAMQSAVASTQVVNGFFVKKTQTVDDSIAYLAQLTKRLARHYADRPLHVLPTRVLTTQNYLPLLRRFRGEGEGGAQQGPAEVGISYAAFASLTSKSELLTLRDVFLKMLMCTRGITGERALEIQKVWPTPYAFVQAYRQAGSSSTADGGDQRTARKRKREMVSDALGGLAGSKRKVSKVLSEKLAEVWADALPEEAA